MNNSEIDFLLIDIQRACELGDVENVIFFSEKLAQKTKPIKFTQSKIEISEETLTAALKNNIPEEIERMRIKQLKNWDLCIRIGKILTLSFMVFLFCLAAYYLIIKNK